jgi:hypothetical protein
MSQSRTFPLHSCGVLVFLITAGVGWNLFVPGSAPAVDRSPETPDVKRAARPVRTARSIAEEAAAGRIRAIRAMADPEARMLATLALADSLDPAEFAAWMDGGWFDLRGGPELMMFSKILMDRWLQEDPEGLITWGEKNGSGAGEAVMNEWALRDPQRLLAWFRNHPNDQQEIRMLGEIASHSPELALQRMREMSDAGVGQMAMQNCRELMDTLAEKCPAELEAMVDSLSPLFKIQVETALSGARMEASFSEEIRNLWDREDGWRIFSGLSSRIDLGTQVLGELGNLPEEWRKQLAENVYQFIATPNAVQWLDADLEGAGFSEGEIRMIRFSAISNLPAKDPARVIQEMGSMETSSGERKMLLEHVFLAGDLEVVKELVSQLPEAEQKTAVSLMESREAGPTMKVEESTTPAELLESICSEEGGTSFPPLENWDRAKIEALAAGFKNLPDDRKAQAAAIIIANPDSRRAPGPLRGEALRYLAEHPASAASKWGERFESLTAQVSVHATDVLEEDPEQASSWVASLPAGEARSWAQMNVLKRWSQYDPDAAAVWKASLSTADRETLENLKP